MATVAIDIDDTLYSFGDLAREMICKEAARTDDSQLMNAAYMQWNEWRTPADALKERWIEIIDMCHQPEVITQQQPFAGVYDVLWRIVKAGHDIMYISNRKEELYGATEMWLNMHGFPAPVSWEKVNANVSLVCTTEDKTPFMKHCQYLIDDRPKTLVSFVNDFNWKNKFGSRNDTMARKGFGLHCEYNCGLTDVPGIYLAKTWVLLDKFLIEKGVAASATTVTV